MIETYSYNGTTWVRLISPTAEQLAEVRDTYAIEPEAFKDLASPTPRQKIETYEHSIYAVFHIPAYKHSHSKSHLQEIDFVIGKNFIITVQYDTIDALQKLSKEAEMKSLIGKENADITPDMIFVEVLHALYGSVSDEISYLEDQLRVIEDNIFGGLEKEMVSVLSKTGRDILDLKRTLASQKRLFESLILIASKAKNKALLHRVESLYHNSYMRIYEQIKHDFSLAKELRETNNSLLFTKQNEVMKLFTILAFVTFPLSLVTGLFGMNTTILPIVGLPHDFWIIFGFMVVATIFFFGYFKYKKWL